MAQREQRRCNGCDCNAVYEVERQVSGTGGGFRFVITSDRDDFKASPKNYTNCPQCGRELNLMSTLPVDSASKSPMRRE